jgi:hypothetical protein
MSNVSPQIMSSSSFSYSPKWTTGTVGIAFGTAIAYAGLSVFQDPIAFSRTHWGHLVGLRLAKPVSLLVLLIGLAILAAALQVTIVAIRGARTISFSRSHFTFPHGLLLTSSTDVPYNSVVSIAIEKLADKRALRVKCRTRSLYIVESMLAGPDKFDELVLVLNSRTGVTILR